MSAEYFSTAALQKQVDTSIATLVPSDRRHCVIAYVDCEGVARVAYAAHVDDHWRIGGQFEADLKARKIRGALVVERSW